VLCIAARAHATTPETERWSFEPTSYNFGTQIPNAPVSARKAFTLTNTGQVSLTPTYTGIQWSSEEGEEPALFTIASDNCGTLEPGASCTIEVTFNPIFSGRKLGVLTVADVKPSPYGASTSTYLEGFGAGQVVSITPPVTDFGSRAAGAGPSPFQVVKVANVGQADLKITSVSLARDFHFDDDQFALMAGGTCGQGVIVPPLGFCTVRVAFAPTAVSRFSADLRIGDNAPDSPQYATVEGTGVPSRAGSVQVTIVRHPRKVTRKREAEFTFSGSDNTVTFQCKLDKHAFAPCRSPVRFAHLRIGSHQFSVRGVNGAGQVGSRPARFQWRIEPGRSGKAGS
jgi:hypothetical protein